MAVIDAVSIRRIVSRLLGLILSALMFAAPATAASVTELVSERSAQEYGAEMPSQGYFVVRLSEGNITEGEYIQEFWTDPRNGQFIANIVTSDGDIRRVWGSSTLSVQIPVPVARLMPDSIIQAENLQLIELPWARIGDFAVTSLEDLVGKQVLRVLNSGKAVQTGSITLPIVVSRGERVRLQLKQGLLHLETRGKAISDGYIGQEVRVVNLASNMTVVGFAVADGLVEVKN